MLQVADDIMSALDGGAGTGPLTKKGMSALHYTAAAFLAYLNLTVRVCNRYRTAAKLEDTEDKSDPEASERKSVKSKANSKGKSKGKEKKETEKEEKKRAPSKKGRYFPVWFFCFVWNVFGD